MRQLREGSRSHARYLNKRKQAYAHAEKAAIVGLICIVAVPVALCACVWFGSCKLATGEYPRFGCGNCCRNRPRYYTENEWKTLKRTPKPEVIQLWTDDENDQGQLLAEDVKVNSVTRKENPTSSRIDPAPPFRLLDLPTDVQLMIFKMLVLSRSDQQWDALANYCRDGFTFNQKHKCHSTPKDTCITAGKHDQSWSTKDKHVIYRTSHTAPTRSLLRASRAVRNLTLSALDSSFSGTFRFEGRQRTSQLDEPWGWYNIDSHSPIIARNSQLLHRVTMLETPHYQQSWPQVLEILPSLTHIKIIPHHACQLLLLDDQDQEMIWLNDDIGRKFMGGEFDQQIVQRCLEIARRWTELMESATEYKQIMRLSVCMRYHFGGYCRAPHQPQIYVSS